MNLRPSGYEPDELPGCSTPRYQVFAVAKTDKANLFRFAFSDFCLGQNVVSVRFLPEAKYRC